ncbi:unnamed protein product [Closterium sp. NIES-64]|nr:unnamed protein product [Closterium sp. NIES-64]
MVGSATQAAIESGGADAAAESGGNGSGWVNIPLQPWIEGQPPVEKDVEDAYVPTAEEVAAAAADSAGENEVEVEEEVDEEGVGETCVGRGGSSARGRVRARGRAGRVQGRSSEGATEDHGGRHAGGTSRGGRGGGRVGRVAQGGGDARAEGSAPVEDGPSRADTQRNEGVGGTPLRAGGTSRGGGTSGGRQRRMKRQREIWVRLFLDPEKRKDLQFPLGGYGMDGKGPVVPDGDGAWEHAASWPNIPATAAEGVGGGTSGGIRAASMSSYITPRVQEQELRSALVEIRSVRRLPPAVDAALARARGARERVELEGAVAGEVGLAGGVGVAVEVVAGVEVLVEAVEAEVAAEEVAEEAGARVPVGAVAVETGVAVEAGVAVAAGVGVARLSGAALGVLEGSHTASLIAKTLEGILAEWGLTEMLFAVTTDNAENNNKAMRMLAGDPAEGAMARIEFPLFHGDRHVRCIAHVMNIAVKAALKKDVVTEALKRLRAVCSYVGWSVQCSENFARQQRILLRWDDAPVLRLIGDSPTRLGSTYDMIVRALELQQALALLLMRTGVSGGGTGRGVTAAMGWSGALITAAFDKLKKYKYGEKEELMVATFLDPRYKTVFFQLPKWEARNAAHVTEVGGCARRVQDVDEGTVIRLVRARMAEYQARVNTRRQGGEVTSDTGGAIGPSSVTGGASGTTGAGGGGGGGFEHSIFDEMDALEAAAGGGAQDEVDRYLAEPRQRGGCPLAFWRAREDVTVLREMARDYLAVPATSAASERAFSQGRNIITWQRHRLTAGRVRAVMAIKSWMEQNTSGRSLNIAGAARVLDDLCYEEDAIDHTL